MEVEFEDADLQKLYTDPRFDGGFSRGIVKAFRKRMQMIRGAPDERVFYSMKSLHFEKLKGKRANEHSMRINDQFRLILKFSGKGNDKKVIIISIEDYH